MFVGELANPHRERGGKQETEPPLRGRHASQQEADVPDESEIEHPIRFVEHRYPHSVQVIYLLLEVVDEPSRGADEHVETVAKHLALRLVAGPAEHDAEPQPGMQTDLLGVPVNLDRQLASGRDHDGSRLPLSLRPVGAARAAAHS